MACEITKNTPQQTAERRPVASYDSGYEHSFDHYVDLKCMVEDAYEESVETPATFAKAS
jgi:hypothetical protein